MSRSESPAHPVGSRVDRGRGTPLWQQVLDDLRLRAGAGELTEGLPPDTQLVAEYGVSRHTIREAARRFRAADLHGVDGGRTSRLTPPAEIDQPLGTLYNLFSSVAAAGQEQHSVTQVLDVRTDEVVSARLGLPPAAPLVHLERLRFASGVPLALDRVWIPAEVGSALLDVDFSHTALYAELTRRCGVPVTGGQERIRAVVVTPAERRLLEMPDGVAAFAIERLGTSGTRAVEWRHTLVRGDRFAVSARFSGGRSPEMGGAVTDRP